MYCFKKSFYKIIIYIVSLTTFYSCSLSDIYNDNTTKDLNKKQNINYLNTDCPIIIIPKETYKYINVNNSKKSIFNIEKAQIICKEAYSKNMKKLLVDYKININTAANYKIDSNNVSLPKIYLAIVEKKNNKVLIKVLSKTSPKDVLLANQNNKIINKGKFKINHNNQLKNLNIYIGFQTNTNRVK